jgi:hypothetical protein
VETERKVFVVIWDDGGIPNCDTYANVYAMVEALPDDDERGIREAAKQAEEHPGEPFDFPPQMFGTLRYVSVAECHELLNEVDDKGALKGYEVMQEVMRIVLNREELTPKDLSKYFEANSAEELYDSIIAPAVDAVERNIRDTLDEL